MLPDLLSLFDGTTGTSHYAQRLREIALSRVAEASAAARSNRAARTRSTTPGQAFDFEPGELVDFYSPSQTRDTSGWGGPAEIVKMEAGRGTVTINCCGSELICKLDDVRRFMDFGGPAYGLAHTFSC